EQNLPFAVLAALSGRKACSCEVAGRVKGSSAAFLTLSQQKLASTLAALHEQGLLENLQTDGSCRVCQATYSLTPYGRYALSDLVSQLETWHLTELTLRREVKTLKNG